MRKFLLALLLIIATTPSYSDSIKLHNDRDTTITVEVYRELEAGWELIYTIEIPSDSIAYAVVPGDCSNYGYKESRESSILPADACNIKFTEVKYNESE